MLQVGPGRSLSVPSEAAQIARDGDVVEISAAFYEGDVAIWPENDLTIRVVGRRAHVGAGRQLAEDKGIWVIKGRDAAVEHVEVSRARGPHRNGCGPRGEGIGAKSFTLRASYSHHTRVRRGGDRSGQPGRLSLTPAAQYVYRTAEEPRPRLGAFDIGAYGSREPVGVPSTFDPGGCSGRGPGVGPVNRPKVEQASDHPTVSASLAGRCRSMSPRFHTLAGLFHRLNDFRNVGPLPTPPTGPFSLAVSYLPKHISALTERAQKHSFSAFSWRLGRHAVAATSSWPGICIAKRLGST